MFLTETLENVKAVCLYKTNRAAIKKQFVRRKIDDVEFVAHCPHSDVIRNAFAEAKGKGKGDKNVGALCIFEDDAKIELPFTKLAKPPDDWDLLYLGGLVRNIYGDDITAPWIRVGCRGMHAYVINLKNKEMIKEILEFVPDPAMADSFETFYLNKIHTKYNVYVANPMCVIKALIPAPAPAAPAAGATKETLRKRLAKTRLFDASYMQNSLQGFRKPSHEEDANGNYILRLPAFGPDKLPPISVVTPTRNRKRFFPLMKRNILTSTYPQDKIEWLIVDDSPNEDLDAETVEMRKTFRGTIRYIPTPKEEAIPIGAKRNTCVFEASHYYIVHMDDDDYYVPDSFTTRVKLLLKYAEQKIECVGCSTVGTYNIKTNVSSVASDAHNAMCEASMAYTRRFWQRRSFNKDDRMGEYLHFIKDRWSSVIDFPYVFNMFLLTHGSNMTGTMREANKTTMDVNYIDEWDEDTRQFVNELAKVV